MRALCSEFSLGRMAKFLGVARSAYYAHFKRPIPARERDDVRIEAEIVGIHKKSRESYGVDRIDGDLRKKNIRCHRRRILRLMKKAGIRGKLRTKRVRTTDSSHTFAVSPDLLQRNFSAAKPNQTWVSDITYIATHEGWLYLCTILDLYSRKVVGWAMSASLESSFVVDALRMALERRKPPAGLTFHSDRGIQYASAAFRKELSRYAIRQSMSRRGNCLDNACAESFFGTIKTELPATIFWSRAEARREIFDYIEGFYNPRRSHSTLGYMSPDEFEARGWAA